MRRRRACGPAVDVTLRLLDGVEEMVHTTPRHRRDDKLRTHRNF
jgi:hypothetical protein